MSKRLDTFRKVGTALGKGARILVDTGEKAAKYKNAAQDYGAQVLPDVVTRGKEFGANVLSKGREVVTATGEKAKEVGAQIVQGTIDAKDRMVESVQERRAEKEAKKSAMTGEAEGEVAADGIDGAEGEQERPKPDLNKTVTGLNSIFQSVYGISGGIGIIIFVCVVMLAFWDLVMYVVRESNQKRQIMFNPGSTFNGDTVDAQVLSYISYSTTDEPFNVHSVQKLVSLMFIIAGIAIIMLGIQVGAFFSIKLYSYFAHIKFEERLSIDPRTWAILGIILLAATVMNNVYKSTFIKNVQKTLGDIRSTMGGVRTYIYDHLTTDAAFLNAMLAEDVDGQLAIIRTKIEANNNNTCDNTSETTYCDAEVEKLLFTISIYQYVKTSVPDTDPSYNTIRSMFTPQGIQQRNVNLPLFFYYKQPIYIPNLYSVLQGYIGAYFKDRTGNKSDVRESAFATRFSNTMEELNRKLAMFYTIPTGKHKMRNYILATFGLALFFMAAFGLLYFDKFIDIAAKAMKYLKSITEKIKAKPN